MLKIVELRKKDKEKLLEQLKESQIKLADKKLMVSSGNEKNTSIFKSMRKDIAVIKTVIKEKEILA